MDRFSFRISTKRYLGEDCTIDVHAGGDVMPAVALKVADPAFPLSLSAIAANIESMLNGNPPFALAKNGQEIFFARRMRGFDLHFREGGGVSRKGVEIRMHAAALSEGVRGYVEEKLLPENSSDLAEALCRPSLATDGDNMRPGRAGAKPQSRPA